MVTKTLNELQKLQGTKKVTSSSSSNFAAAAHKSITVQNSSKKKIQKLHRACTGSVISPHGLMSDTEGLIGSKPGSSVVSPRKLIKEGPDSKSRNATLGGSKATTQSQNRIVTFH